MNVKTCPCGNCPERFLACSDKCPKDARGEFGYKAWADRCNAEKKHFKENKYRFSIPSSEARDNMRWGDHE